MTIAPDHLHETQGKKYKEELRRKGLLKVFVVATDPYMGGEPSIDLHEARSLKELVKEFGYESIDAFQSDNGDGTDYVTISELVTPIKGKKVCDYKLKLKEVVR